MVALLCSWNYTHTRTEALCLFAPDSPDVGAQGIAQGILTLTMKYFCIMESFRNPLSFESFTDDFLLYYT
jgi:hypothetical protein